MTVSPFVTGAPGLDLPRGVRFWTDPDMTYSVGFQNPRPRPTFDDDEVAKMFGFGRRWMQLTRREQQIGETEIGPIMAPPPGRPNRWTLHNVERFALVLVERGIIEPWRAAGVVQIVKALACQHGWLDRIQRRERMAFLEREGVQGD